MIFEILRSPFMKEKKVFYSELAYIAALLILPLGIVLMEKADLGISMVAAPPYLLFLKLYETYPLFSFGFSDYFVQFLILLLLIVILRKIRLHFFFSFITAFLYGTVLDFYMLLLSFETPASFPLRLLLFAGGLYVSAFGIAFFFKTYIAPDIHALFIKEVSEKWNRSFAFCKTIYDCTCCLIAIAMSFIFFGFGVFEAIKWGTVVCALVNGKNIGFFCDLMDKHFEFSPRFPALQKHFN